LQEIHPKNYTTDKIVISSVGNVEMKKLVRWVLRYFSEIPAVSWNGHRKPFTGYQQKQITRKRKIFQTHCIIGTTGYSVQDERSLHLPF